MIARLNVANAAEIQRLAAKTGVSIDLTVNWILERALGTATPSKRRGRPPLLTDVDRQKIRIQYADGARTYAELAERWNVSVPTIRRACGSLKTNR